MATSSFPIHEPGVPYTDPPTRLQTLDVWLPRPLEQSADDAVWVVFVHGGAWRDPHQTSLNYVLPTLAHLSDSSFTSPSIVDKIAGLASISYRLSPYPGLETDGNDHSDAKAGEPGQVQHPMHIRDIEMALNFLRKKYDVGETALQSIEEGEHVKSRGNRKGFRWIGIGQSCGATLLLQHVARIGLDTISSSNPPSSPSALILTGGIYSLPQLLLNHTPPHCPENIAEIYRQIVTGAFGAEDQSVYESVSPVAASWDAATLQRNGAEALRWIGLVHSPEDQLVEGAQREIMEKRLKEDGWVGAGEREGGRVVERREARGIHDFVWRDGKDLAGLVGEVVGKVISMV